MSHTMNQRAARVVGAAAILALSVGGPATARQDVGEGTSQGSMATTQLSDEQYRCHYLNECTGAVPTPTPAPRVDGTAIEYLQVGVGVLAGIGIAGAGMAAASRRRHAHAALPA
jgi:hypothetical protein